MRYRITHSTEFSYSEPVTLCHNVARLRPRNTPGQTCLRHDLVISPVPALRRDRLDFFGNHLCAFSLQEPHTALSVMAQSEVDLTASPQAASPPPLPWEEAVAFLRGGASPEARLARAFTFGSRWIRPDPELVAYAQASFPPGRALAEAALDLTLRIHREFRFVPGATRVGTSPVEVLRTRQGVCQDFAHLQIGCLRSLGLAARYVSGYMKTDPPAGGERLQGADASHAWLSIFLPGFGWIDLDPTRGSTVADAHITAGWARDYDDVAPLKGVLVGGLRQTLKVAVDVVPLG